MALTKLPKSGIADDAIDASKIEDGTIQNQELAGSLSEDKLATGTIENASLSNSSITFRGTSRSLGDSFSLGVDIDWQAVVTGAGGSSTASAGLGYIIDTSSNTHTLNLPASASLGDTIAVKDYAGTFATNSLTIGRNGHNIQGAANDSEITTNRASLVLVYVDATKGWIYVEESNVADLEKNILVTATGGTVTTSGDYKIHTFTGDGCFVVSAGAGPVAVVDYLVVAGGGAGGGIMGAGGGAGGYRESHSTPVSGPYTASPLATPTGLPVSTQTYPITVGAGGTITAPGAGYPSPGGSPGSDSIFSTITSSGGGGGATAGGSGGGKNRYVGCGAAGNTPPVTPPQGNPGGSIPSSPADQDNVGAGGGGAGGAGGNANSTPFPTPVTIVGGPGGAGVTTSISGSPVTRAGGGGGGTRTGSPTFGAPSPALGGSGGGGNGGYGSPGACNGVAGTAGSTNTGSGGGGGHYHACNAPAPFPNPAAQDRDLPGGNGGKGIVIIRYKFQ